MTKKKGNLQVKWAKMRAVRTDSNIPFDRLFKYELNAPGQCVTIDNEIREASKHLKEIRKKERKSR